MKNQRNEWKIREIYEQKGHLKRRSSAYPEKVQKVRFDQSL